MSLTTDPTSRRGALKLAHVLNNDTDSGDEHDVKTENSRLFLNTELYKEDVHGLMTPLSSDTMSPRIGRDENEIPETILASLVKSDLRRSTLETRLPNLTWTDILKQLEDFDVPRNFTKQEMVLVVSQWYRPGPIDYHMLEEQCALRSRKQIHFKISVLEDLYGSRKDELDEMQITAFEVCNDCELFLKDDVSKLMPNLSPEESRRLILKYFPHKPRWLAGELEFMTESLKNGDTLESTESNLLFRKRTEVKNKLEALHRKMQREASPAPTPPPLTEEEEVYNALIEDFVKTDLTASGLQDAVASESYLEVVEDIHAAIAKAGGSGIVPFTKKETDFLRRSLRASNSQDNIKAELPFRTEADIEAKLKRLEIACVRQKKFANDVERLIYEAQWYASMADDAKGGRRRRHTRNEVGLEDLKVEALREKTPAPATLTEEELLVKQKARELRSQRRADTIKRRAEERELLREQRKAKPVPVRRLRGTKRGHKEAKSTVSALLEEARWFQSVTGDGKYIKSGDKRKRKPTYHLIPEFQNRQQIKNAQRSLVEKKNQKPSKGRRGRKPTTEELSGSETDSDADELEELQEAIESVKHLNEETEVSPFDPLDIQRDTIVPLNGRQLFNSAISSGSLNPQFINFSKDLLMLAPDDRVPFCNTSAVQIIEEHMKSYRSMPLTFPPLEIVDAGGKTRLNPLNLVNVRFLLCPQHTEQFVLAHPKSNELDPTFELQKVFQIHYALYFSYSPVLKDIISNDYCKTLTDAIEEDDFPDFMAVIDKWNTLMLELCPYITNIDPSDDINAHLRSYLPKSSKPLPTALDLKLNTFYYEILSAGENSHRSTKTDPRRTSVAHLLASGSPHILKQHRTRFDSLRPMSYSKAFNRQLNLMEGLSRFCVQQLLLRAYTRIVSPDSRKLRSYKAFTAEVYGELLPSFVSEVLTKVDLRPEHKFYDLGSGVGNTTFQAALEFGVKDSGGCEIMKHASKLTSLQDTFLKKELTVWGLDSLNLSFALLQSFVNNEEVRKKCVECNVLLVNNYLFDFPLNVEVGKLLYGLTPGSKIISLRNFIPPRYKAGTEKTVFDYLKVKKYEMSDYLSVSWTANKVPYYISTVEPMICPEYL